MKPKAGNIPPEIDRQIVSGKTVKAYFELAGKCSKKKALTDEQKNLIKVNWKKKRERKTKKAAPTTEQKEVEWDNIFDEIQQFGTEIQEFLEPTKQCDFNNVHEAVRLQ